MMSFRFSNYLFALLLLPVLFSCAHDISVVSCTRQEHYPGTQEEKPFQEIIVELDTISDAIQIDSLHYGNQVLMVRTEQTRLIGKAEGTAPSSTATLYFTQKKKRDSIEITDIKKLEALYLP